MLGHSPQPMTTSRLLAPLALLSVCSGLHAATTISFDDQTALNTAFPTASQTVIGGNSAVSLLGDPNRVSLRAESTAASAARVTLYSSAAYSAGLDFISSGLTLTFDSARLDFASSGASYNGRFGLSSTATDSLSSANAIYFQINRSTETLSLVQSVGGETTALHTWTTADLNFAYHNITSLSLTLTASTWEVNGTVQRKDNATQTGVISGGGSLGVVWTAETWGGDTFVGLEANQTAGTAGRWSDLQIGEIGFSTIPEPRAVALIAGAMGLAFAGGLHRRGR